METEPPTFQNIIKDFSAPGYIKRARGHTEHRKSRWNIVPVILLFILWPSIIYILFEIMWFAHIHIYPEHAAKFKEFWGEGISITSFISSFLLVTPLLLASLPISLMLANIIAWFITPARLVFDKEAKKAKWGSFNESMAGLWNISRIIVPICLSLSLIGAATLSNLK